MRETRLELSRQRVWIGIGIVTTVALMGATVFLLRNVNLFVCIGCGVLCYGGFLSWLWLWQSKRGKVA